MAGLRQCDHRAGRDFAGFSASINPETNHNANYSKIAKPNNRKFTLMGIFSRFIINFSGTINKFVRILNILFISVVALSVLLAFYFSFDVIYYLLFDRGGAAASLYAQYGLWFPGALATAIFIAGTGGAVTAMLRLRRSAFYRFTPELDMEIEEFEASKSATKKAQIIKKLAASESVEKNIRNPVRVAHVEAQSFGILKNCAWTLQPGVNLLLGRNGYGKTYFLRTLIAAIAQDGDAAESLLSATSSNATFTVFFQRVTGEGKSSQPPTIGISDTQQNTEPYQLRSSLEVPGIVVGKIGKVPVLAIPDTRFINKSRRNFLPPEEASDLKMNGGLQFARQQPYEDIVQSFLYEIAINALKKGGEIDRLPVGRMIQKVVQELTGTEFRFQSVDHARGAGLRIMVVFESDQMDPVPLQVASQGTLSILSIFGLIWSFLESLYGELDTDDMTDASAIVVIDEVDAHLHPAWQQRIVGLLRRTFPSVQFILTAHSPLVVAGCLDGEVAIIRRNAKAGGLEIHQIMNDFIGRDIEEISRTVFEIEEFDETFQDYQAKRLKKPAMEKRYKQLKNENRLSRRETIELKQLENDLYYLSKLEKRLEQFSDEKLGKAELERLKMENRALKRRLGESHGSQPLN